MGRRQRVDHGNVQPWPLIEPYRSRLRENSILKAFLSQNRNIAPLGLEWV